MIKKLSKNLINQIAAGEVVERPASVVKELMENAIDAGSSKIIVKVEDGGLSLISVSDNGIGISADDIQLVFEQHATSKISSIDDLFNILTLGFRGEALASIASVSKSTKIVSRPKNEGERAIQATYTDEGITTKEISSHEVGTSVEVNDLFINIPARRKFLKSELTERKHIYNTFLSTALPYLGIHFELYTNGKLTLRLSETDEIKNRIFEAFGKETAKHMLNGSGEAFNIKIHGVVGDTHLGQKHNRTQFIYVNNRYVKSPLIHQAIMNAYQGHMHRDLKPSYVLMLEVNPSQVDVNIHPRKYEVKFEQEKQIFSAVRSFVLSAITNTVGNNDVLENEHVNESVKPTFTTEHSPRTNKTRSMNSSAIKDAMSFTKTLYSNRATQSEDGSFLDVGPTINPNQIFNTYICFEEEGKLIFIDQHAAAEKIMFEKLLKQANSVRTKPMLIPQIINLNSDDEKETLLEQRDELKKIGFSIDDFGKKAVQVYEVPEISDIRDFDLIVSDLLKQPDELGIEFLDEIASDFGVTRSTYLKIATLACHGSIRAGQPLSGSEMLQIIGDIKTLTTGLTCPHGRPIMWEMKKTEIERNFNRDI